MEGLPGPQSALMEKPRFSAIRWSSALIIVGALLLCALGGLVRQQLQANSSPHPTLVSGCQVIRRSGTYLLTRDVSSDGTCFAIESDHVVLDLGGHAITFAENPRGKLSFGISAIACFDPDVNVTLQAPREGCSISGVVDRLTVLNGRVIQSARAIAKSHGIRVGQARSAEGLTVHDVRFQLGADSSVAVYTVYAGQQVLYNNMVDSKVKRIANRHQIEGASFKLESSEKFSGGEIFNNHLLGGPQGGIFLATANSAVHDNEISQDGYYWNDFAIYAWGNNEQVFNNSITPKNGRGIQIGGGAVNVNGPNKGATNVAVYGNRITVVESPQTHNDPNDTPACELGGAYGIQFDDNPAKSSAYRNDVLALADKCEGVGLKLTEIGPDNESHNNTYLARRMGNTSQTAAAVLTGGASGFRSQNDTLIADTATIAFDWDGGSDLIFQNPVLEKGTNPAPNYVTFSFQNGGRAVSNIHIIDAEFRNGAAKLLTDMQPIGAQQWHMSAEYYVDWSLRMTVKDREGKPVRGASVMVDDAQGAQAFSGLTEAGGVVKTVLTEFHVYNTKKGIEKERRAPYSLQIRKSGCTAPAPLIVNLTKATILSVEMLCN